MEFVLKLTNKYYEDRQCQCCNKQINYVFEVDNSNKLCRTCAAKMIANSTDGSRWEHLDRVRRQDWERQLVNTSSRRDPLLEGNIFTNKKNFPILKTIEKAPDQHPEIRRTLGIAHHKQLLPSYITNLKWVLDHLELFNNPSWRIDMQKKIWLLARTGTVYRQYYLSLQRFLINRKFLTEKQLNSINKNYQTFRSRIAKLCLKRAFVFSTDSLGRLRVKENYIR